MKQIGNALCQLIIIMLTDDLSVIVIKNTKSKIVMYATRQLLTKLNMAVRTGFLQNLSVSFCFVLFHLRKQLNCFSFTVQLFSITYMFTCTHRPHVGSPDAHATQCTTVKHNNAWHHTRQHFKNTTPVIHKCQKGQNHALGFVTNIVRNNTKRSFLSCMVSMFVVVYVKYVSVWVSFIFNHEFRIQRVATMH